MGWSLLGGSQFLDKSLRGGKLLKTLGRRQFEPSDQQREVNPEILGGGNLAARRWRYYEPD
jgi:hypothetical protein